LIHTRDGGGEKHMVGCIQMDSKTRGDAALMLFASPSKTNQIQSKFTVFRKAKSASGFILSISDNVLVGSRPFPGIGGSGSCKWAVKLRRLFFNANFRTCSASINSGFILFLFLVSVSALEEKTLSQGTADAWIGR
jgi:hypothetical protein